MIKTQYRDEDYAIYIALLINEVESDHCCSVVRRITQAVEGKVERERKREKGENIVEDRELWAKRQVKFRRLYLSEKNRGYKSVFGKRKLFAEIINFWCFTYTEVISN